MRENVNLTDAQKKSIFRSIFITIFLDIAGFAIIFPIIPQLIDYYTTLDAQNIFLNFFWKIVDGLALLLGSPSTESKQTVLFGCLIGSLYSAVQFFASPIWGKLSDEIGRKNILRWTLLGTLLSYVLWVVSGSFTLLVVARLVGGLCSGNISVATAVIADITDSKSRSSGMAYVGIAFALGFVFGPAIGGLLAHCNLLTYFPSLAEIGINPFSVPALFALLLSFINVIVVNKWLPETLKNVGQNQGSSTHRTSNIIEIFKPHKNPSINLINMGYFLFISLFAGMEFTLTFLTVERLDFEPMHNGFLFVFIGLMIALVQGGFVRRRAHLLGEKKVALMGLVLIIPGLVALAFTHNLFLLLLGLFFLSAGSAMTIPTTTALISLFASDKEQGHVLGIFRALGSLGRIVGPVWASLIFWRWGSTAAYLTGALSLLLPILVLKNVSSKKN
jgi:MFS family permease